MTYFWRRLCILFSIVQTCFSYITDTSIVNKNQAFSSYRQTPKMCVERKCQNYFFVYVQFRDAAYKSLSDKDTVALNSPSLLNFLSFPNCIYSPKITMNNMLLYSKLYKVLKFQSFTPIYGITFRLINIVCIKIL